MFLLLLAQFRALSSSSHGLADFPCLLPFCPLFLHFILQPQLEWPFGWRGCLLPPISTSGLRPQGTTVPGFEVCTSHAVDPSLSVSILLPCADPQSTLGHTGCTPIFTSTGHPAWQSPAQPPTHCHSSLGNAQYEPHVKVAPSTPSPSDL